MDPLLSFYGADPVPLPVRFAHIKRRLVDGHRDELLASWQRLLLALEEEIEHIAAQGPSLIPSIDFAAITDDDVAVDGFRQSLKKCGVGVVRGVVAPGKVAAWADETRAYVASTAAAATTVTPPQKHDPTCHNYFWSPAQVRARADGNVLQVMRFVMGFWGGGGSAEAEAESDADAPLLSTRCPIAYADRIRIHGGGGGDDEVGRKTASAGQNDNADNADSAASAGYVCVAQLDGGSLERWEPDGYGRAGTYAPIFRGRWQDYDPWLPTGRVAATPDLYNGAGACSIFRMFQGLLALTDVAPGMVRLLPSPKLAVAYILLRPFFCQTSSGGWQFDPSSIVHGAVPGHAQRVTDRWHPHLQLARSLVSLPPLHPGDYIVWHCDTAYTIGG